MTALGPMKPRNSGVRAAAAAQPEPPDIGPASEADLPRIVEMLNDTAAESIANFASRPVSVADRRDWFRQFSVTGPYRALVARRGGRVVGYACTQRYRDHEAFRETVEISIALDATCRGQGVATTLYRELLDSIAQEPVHVIVAGVALPNAASVALHRKFGFTEVGTFREYAVKNGQYISSLWMQRLCYPSADPARPPSARQSGDSVGDAADIR